MGVEGAKPLLTKPPLPLSKGKGIKSLPALARIKGIGFNNNLRRGHLSRGSMKGRSPFKNHSSPSPLKERGIKGVRLIINLNKSKIFIIRLKRKIWKVEHGRLKPGWLRC